MTRAEPTAPSPARRGLAWAVHAFTASSAVVGTVALLDVARGDLRRAGLLMLVTLAIDSVDGTLARAVGAAQAVPAVDGRRLDDVVDYFTYVIVPAVFLLGSGSLAHWAWAIAPILASSYGFAQHEAKTEDHFFLGWPSYWNVVALYLWLLDVPTALATVLVLVFALAVFVPLRYVYPSRTPRWRGATVAGGFVWILVVAYALRHPQRAADWHLVGVSLVYPAYYLALSAWTGGWMRALRPRKADDSQSRPPRSEPQASEGRKD